MGEKDFNANVLSENARAKLDAYHAKNEALHSSMNEFFENYSDELEGIDKLREDRNEALDDLRKTLRAEVGPQPINKISKVIVDEFTIQKKWSSWYVVEQFVELAQSCGMYDSAVAEGVIQEITKVDAKLAEEWLRKNSLQDTFEVVVDGKELTPAVSGPKEIPAFGAETK